MQILQNPSFYKGDKKLHVRMKSVSCSLMSENHRDGLLSKNVCQSLCHVALNWSLVCVSLSRTIFIFIKDLTELDSIFLKTSRPATGRIHAVATCLPDCASPTGAVHAGRNLRRLPEEEGVQGDSSEDEPLAGAPGSRQRQGRTRVHSKPGLQAAAGRAAGSGLPVPPAGPR